MTIRCITFDLDDTLWDCAPVIAGAERRFYHWLTEHYPRIPEHFTPESLIEHRKTWFGKYPDMHHDLTRLRKRWLSVMARESGYDEAMVEPAFRVFWEARNEVCLYDDVLATLERLRGRFVLGSITNGNADVHHIGIGQYFDFSITAAGTGVAKPHPAIFTAALDEGGVAAHETLHVGDDPERDVVGAARVGLRTLWVNPRDLPAPEGCRPDGVVRRVGEIPGWVDGRLKDEGGRMNKDQGQAS